MEKTFSVKKGEAGERLDKWLCKKIPQHSRQQIKKLLDSGLVLINNRRVVIAGWAVEDFDKVEVRVPADFKSVSNSAKKTNDDPQEKNKKPTKKEISEKTKVAQSLEKHLERGKKKKLAVKERNFKEAKELRIFYEDRDIIVVDKPAGVLTLRKDKHDQRGNTMVEKIRKYLTRKYKNPKGVFVGAVHRLDADTTGVMVFALSNIGKQMEKLFRSHQIKREYVAIAAGRVPKQRGTIDKPLEKGDYKGGKKTQVSDDGKRAKTLYSVDERYKDATLLTIEVLTGRTHQIRVHLASIGFPLLGDQTYAEEVDAKRFPRQALHARLLQFKHPESGKKMRFVSPIPEDMKECIDNLRMDSE